jgi:hypothetical protein
MELGKGWRFTFESGALIYILINETNAKNPADKRLCHCILYEIKYPDKKSPTNIKTTEKLDQTI